MPDLEAEWSYGVRRPRTGVVIRDRRSRRRATLRRGAADRLVRHLKQCLANGTDDR